MQSLINAIAKFSPDEQRAWVSKTGTAQDFDTLLGWYCVIMRHSPEIHLICHLKAVMLFLYGPKKGF